MGRFRSVLEWGGVIALVVVLGGGAAGCGKHRSKRGAGQEQTAGVQKPKSEQDRLDSVITKFQSDNRSFEEFVLLGRMLCYSKVIGLSATVGDETCLYFGLRVRLYNSLAPFTRLFSDESIIKSHEDYFLLNKGHFEKYDTQDKYCDRGNSQRYPQIKLCDSLFDKNENYKKYYLQFVNNRENYRAPDSDWSEKAIKAFWLDYLENYYMRGLLDDPHPCEL
jgi:hypothetical protein